MDRAGLAAAWVHGDSMIYRGVYNGDLAIFQRYDFDYLYNDSVVVIEKVGDEEGFGAWALKKLVIKPPAHLLKVNVKSRSIGTIPRLCFIRIIPASARIG